MFEGGRSEHSTRNLPTCIKTREWGKMYFSDEKSSVALVQKHESCYEISLVTFEDAIM